MSDFVLMELTHDQKKQLLENSDFANDFTSIQLDKLADYFKSYSLKSASPVMEEGEANSIFCLLCEGKVDVVKESSSGEMKTLQTLGPGKMFGELSFFDGSPCSASVVAKEEIKLLVLHRDEFASLSETTPSVALSITLNLIKNLSQRLRQTTGKLIDLI